MNFIKYRPIHTTFHCTLSNKFAIKWWSKISPSLKTSNVKYLDYFLTTVTFSSAACFCLSRCSNVWRGFSISRQCQCVLEQYLARVLCRGSGRVYGASARMCCSAHGLFARPPSRGTPTARRCHTVTWRAPAGDCGRSRLAWLTRSADDRPRIVLAPVSTPLSLRPHDGLRTTPTRRQTSLLIVPQNL